MNLTSDIRLPDLSGNAKRIAGAHSIDDLRVIARRRVPSFVFDYFEGGAETEDAVRRNRKAYRHIRLLPHYYTDISKRSTACELFSQQWSAPFGIAPTGLSALIRPRADILRAQAAAAQNVPFILSTGGNDLIEDVAAAGGDCVWFQIYALRDWAIMEDLINRANQSGIKVLVVTIDVPVPSKRERDLRNGFTIPPRISFRNIVAGLMSPSWSTAFLRNGVPRLANLEKYMPAGRSVTRFGVLAQEAPALDGLAIERIRALWPGKLVIKGVMTAHDARFAIDRGADGVIVSNHGGRQFDASPATVEVLPSVLEEVAGRIPVMIDGGITRGLDVVRCLALGATFVFVGRVPLYGLAAGGRPGVERALAILRGEIDLALAQIGCASPSELSARHVMQVNWA